MNKAQIDITNKPLLELHNFAMETGIFFQSIKRVGNTGKVYACVVEVGE